MSGRNGMATYKAPPAQPAPQIRRPMPPMPITPEMKPAEAAAIPAATSMRVDVMPQTKHEDAEHCIICNPVFATKLGITVTEYTTTLTEAMRP